MKFLNEIIGLAPPSKAAALHCPSSSTASLSQVHSLGRRTLKCACCSLSGKRRENNTRRCPPLSFPSPAHQGEFLCCSFPLPLPKPSLCPLLSGSCFEDQRRTFSERKGNPGKTWPGPLRKEEEGTSGKRPSTWNTCLFDFRKRRDLWKRKVHRYGEYLTL